MPGATELIVHPDRGRFTRAVRTAVPVSLIPLAYLILLIAKGRRTSEGLGWMAIPTVLVLLGLPALLLLVYAKLFAASTVSVTGGVLRMRDWRGREAIIERPAMVLYTHIASSGTSVPWFIVVDDRSQVMLNAKQWSLDELEKVWSALGLRVSGLDEPPDTVKLRRAFPALRVPVAIRLPALVLAFWLVTSIGYLGVVINVFARL